MAYFSAVFVLATTLSVNSHLFTLHYTRTHAGKVKSGRRSSPHHKSSLLGCAIQSALKKRTEQCFFYDITKSVCDATSQTLLCNYRQLNKRTETKKKILFMVCRHGAMCKFTFVPGPGAVNTTMITSFSLSYDILEARYHQTLDMLYWTKGLLGTKLLLTEAGSVKGRKYHHKKMPFRVITFDIDSSVNYIFVLSDKALHKGRVSTNDFETLVRARFYRSSAMFVDKYNRRLYFTCTCTSRSRQDLMRVNYDGKLKTRITQILTRVHKFFVDEKGWNVFTCKRYLYRYNVNTTRASPLTSLGNVKCSGMTSDGQNIYVPTFRKDFGFCPKLMNSSEMYIC